MAGWKKWAFGDLVSADLFQGNVQDQVVQKYADSAARSAALGTAVAEGMVSYRTDSKSVEVYANSGWNQINQTSGNAVINGGFDFWQRGTTFSNPATNTYTADRFVVDYDGSGATRTISQQTFTPGTAPVAGYEAPYYLRYAVSVAGSGNTVNYLMHRIEDGRSFAGQTITISFWAKGDAARSVTFGINQNFGSGGSANAAGFTSSISLTTSWQRFTITGTLPSVAGKTFGAGSFLYLYLAFPGGVQTNDIWGVQLEAGSIATPFKRNAPSIQAELAACQRYYYRWTSNSSLYASTGITGWSNSATNATGIARFPVVMRIPPTSIEYSTLGVVGNGFGGAITAMTLDFSSEIGSSLNITTSGLAATLPVALRAANSASAYLGFSAEL